MPSSITFPVTESPRKVVPSPIPSPIRPSHLPFRRISLPTASSFAHRESVFSIVSADSFPEDDDEEERIIRMAAQGGTKGNGELRTTKAGPVPLQSPRKRRPTRDSLARRPDNNLTVRRGNIVDEFYETEKAYVDGLDLIYEHFLAPIVSSLETSQPLLDRSVITSIFSNFIDIWNLHKSFLSALTSLLKPNLPAGPATEVGLPNLSPLLLAHFPYLSLYTPFITSFPSTIAALMGLVTPTTSVRQNPQYNVHFANFLAIQEADPRCGKLKLRDWLLTIVQRCPRYLLLLKDLINSTEKEDPEYTQLTEVHTLVSKITLSLNTSLHTHAQSLALVALQKATPNLPFQLISPGRNFIKRGSLTQIVRNDSHAEREFLLFSDCFMWLAPAENLSSAWSWSGSGSGASNSSSNLGTPTARPNVKVVDKPPPMMRTRSRSHIDLPTLRPADGEDSVGPSPLAPETPTKMARRRSHYHIGPPPPPPSMVKRNLSVDDKWTYKGHADLVDIEVVIGSALEDERRFEILSPGGSFALFAASEKERDEWTSEIRSAKQQLLISLNATNPNSTLVSSASTNHVRRILQALPHHPSDYRLATLKMASSIDLAGSPGSPLSSNFCGKRDKDKKRKNVSKERRRKVEHWVPPIWIPDSKTSSCMRCGRMFGWRRRRHHCRLCGRCVCAACSSKTFFITEATSNDETSSKAARACDACYVTVFPLVDSEDNDSLATGTNEHQPHNSDTITSLSNLPSWLSMPILSAQRQPQALMAISLKSSHDLSFLNGVNRVEGVDEKERRARIRVRSHQRLRSYQQIMMDFQEQAGAAEYQMGQEGLEKNDDAAEDEDDEDIGVSDVFSSPLRSYPSTPMRKENTARRSKRFSSPAVALHTTSVTARTTEIGANTNAAAPENGIPTGGISPYKRFSLVLAGRNSRYLETDDVLSGAVVVSKNEDGGNVGLAKGVAATKLAALLKKAKGSDV